MYDLVSKAFNPARSRGRQMLSFGIFFYFFLFALVSKAFNPARSRGRWMLSFGNSKGASAPSGNSAQRYSCLFSV
jgi:glycerol uptake facilitator-like aquaporin